MTGPAASAPAPAPATAGPAAPASGLLRWSLFAALIAAAGLPIYIHAPKTYVDDHGVSLAALGGTLALLRLIDVVQDPLLGWLAEATQARRARWVAGATTLMALAMLGLFAVTPPMAPLIWFALTLTLLFSAYSFLTICFYAEGVARAESLGEGGHVRLAGWREAGSLIGVCVAAVAPVMLAGAFDAPFAAFACGFAAFAVVATVAMRPNWAGDVAGGGGGGAAIGNPLALFRPALADRLARRLLAIALVNAAPVAVSSTLFLFFVESRLQAPGSEGGLLLLFFLSAALSTPLWLRCAKRFGPRRSLMGGMVLAIVTFMGATTLGSGDALAFAVICVASGAALGADMVLLPALFARRLGQLGAGGEAAAFGMWSFVSKLSLALAAAVLLPLLDAVGFVSGGANAPEALGLLSLLYGALPCALKLIAIFLLFRTPIPET